MNTIRLFSLFAVIGILFVATGCKSTGRYVRWYVGPPLETNKIALLRVQKNVLTVVLTVDKIDGLSLTKSKFMGNIASTIELMPGQHELWVSYRDSDDNRSTTDAKLSFVAEPGKIYELRGAPLERSFGKAIGQELLFQHWYWTSWIINAETKKVVAGIPRKTPLHWYE
jgi:hypothetical protein